MTHVWAIPSRKFESFSHRRLVLYLSGGESQRRSFHHKVEPSCYFSEASNNQNLQLARFQWASQVDPSAVFLEYLLNYKGLVAALPAERTDRYIRLSIELSII
ncbi:unnamed protein product [Calypogeia fissa]